MSALDLNRMAIAMGKICIALDDLESKMFRIGVIEMIEKPENKYMQNPTLPIVIPLGIFKHRKETIGSAFRLTLGRLLNLAEKNDEINQAVAEILDGGDLYNEIEQSSTLIRRDLFR